MLRNSKESAGWIQKFLKSSCNEFLIEVPKDFIKEPLLQGWLMEELNLRHPKEAFKLLISDRYHEVDRNVENTAQIYYYLAHAKFIVTNQGMDMMLEKYLQKRFGTCPRYYCNQQPLLPIGLHDEHSKSTVKCFCPKCRDIYHPSASHLAHLDGAAFGESFPNVFLHHNLSLCPRKASDSYVPRISGFKIHSTAPELQIYNGTESSNPIKSKIAHKSS